MGLVGNCADVIPELARRGIVPDLLTDQTSAHDPLNGYVPRGLSPGGGRRAPPQRSRGLSQAVATNPLRGTWRACWNCRSSAQPPSTTGTTSAPWRFEQGVKDAYDFPGFVPAYIRPLFCEGRGPFRWVALSGEPPTSIAPTTWCWNSFPDNAILNRWIRLAREACEVSGIAGAICWLGYGERALSGSA